ncbi:hypothetical protein [Paenibacillus sp. USDA918EY]|uniref:hypothetical protein n=1 Tax=Paenibacillus sp. USDA918EY TaxID=2689575 RepID=UPI001358A2A3|nr:hypothetical protein [Paenibacillus sp. USDA918EY]
MLYAVKGNKQLKIQETEKASYLNLGYDIAEEQDGKLVPLESSLSKTVPYAQYEVLQRENAELKEKLEAAGSQEQVETLQKENKSLKEKLAEANKKLKEVGKE